MSNENDNKTLQKIKKTHERIAIISGIVMGLMLSAYFFTFGMLIDRDATAALWFQIITSVLFVFGLIFLKRVAFFLTKILLGMNSDCRRLLKNMSVADLDNIPQ